MNSPTKGAPTVGVVADGAAAHRLTAILERDGLAAAPSLDDGSLTLEVVVLAVESATSGSEDIERAQEWQPSAQLVLVVGSATPAEARQLLVDGVRGLVSRMPRRPSRLRRGRLSPARSPIRPSSCRVG